MTTREKKRLETIIAKEQKAKEQLKTIQIEKDKLNEKIKLENQKKEQELNSIFSKSHQARLEKKYIKYTQNNTNMSFGNIDKELSKAEFIANETTDNIEDRTKIVSLINELNTQL